MQPNISIGTWVLLPNEVRYRIRALFNIPRSGAVEVVDGSIATDGTTHEDFKSLTVEKMQVYLHTSSNDTDFLKLFDKVVARVNEELIDPKDVQVSQNDTITVIIEPKAKKVGKKKQD